MNLYNCCVCGKQIEKDYKIPKTYSLRITCSKECQQIHKKTFIEEKYGSYENWKKSTVEKRVATCIEKYGTKTSSQSEKVKKKAEATCIKRYGTKSSAQSEEIKKKKKENDIVKYGGAPQSLDIIKEKVKTTFENNYGVNNPFKSEKIKAKIKKINQERYQTDHPMQNPLIKEKNLKNSRERRIKLLAEINYDKYPIEFFIKDNIPYFKCKKCNKIWEAKIKACDSYTFFCQNCFKARSPSIVEEDFYSFIKDLFPDVVRRERQIIKPLELDFYIPSKKLAIEIDGTYWHSETNLKKRANPKTYHLFKTRECEKKGIRLIHIFDSEWIINKVLIQSVLKNIAGIKGNTLGGRKTIVKKIDSFTFEKFCLENHLQGKINCKIRLGLFNKDDLCSVMGFNKSKKWDYELVRYCSLQNTSIIGGASKLLIYFERNYQPKSIISYCDVRWFTGQIYLQLGFQLKGNTSPTFYYVKYGSKHIGILHNRQKFMKNKLSSIKGFIYDNKLTEQQNMQMNGYDKIWDCGKIIYLKNY